MNFLPMPREVHYGNGIFHIGYQTPIILIGTAPSALLYANMLKDTIHEQTGLSLSILRGVNADRSITLKAVSHLAPDVYEISITPENTCICGGSDEAICHGVQTLRQWILRHGANLPALQINDKPDFANRGYYLDVSRGRVPTLETLKQYADLLCRYKINQWQLYVEHTYLFRGFSEVWRDETPLTAQEIMELDAYCHARHIELVPSLSTFGHMYKILSTKTFSEFCEIEDSEKLPFTYTYAGDHHTLNVSNDRALDFIKGMMTEYMQLFTSRKFNICADETYDLGKYRSKPLADETSVQTLYMKHVNELCCFLVERGYTPMFWGDIVWRYRDAYSMLPKETICLNWGYLPDQREHEIQVLAEVGATQYACPGVCTWNRWFPLIRNSFDNNRIMCKHAKKHGAIGLLNTDWGDYGHVCHPWFSIPGILYGAAFAWNAASLEFDEMNRAISCLEYGDESESFMQGFTAISNNEVFDWFHAIRYIEQTDADMKAKLLSEVDVSLIPAANANIADALSQIEASVTHMPTAQRDIMQALSIVADGVCIWNEIGAYIAADFADAKVGSALAGRLETWYFSYLGLWRSVSREGCQYKTQAIILKYADLLRGRAYRTAPVM